MIEANGIERSRFSWELKYTSSNSGWDYTTPEAEEKGVKRKEPKPDNAYNHQHVNLYTSTTVHIRVLRIEYQYPTVPPSIVWVEVIMKAKIVSYWLFLTKNAFNLESKYDLIGVRNKPTDLLWIWNLIQWFNIRTL